MFACFDHLLYIQTQFTRKNADARIEHFGVVQPTGITMLMSAEFESKTWGYVERAISE